MAANTPFIPSIKSQQGLVEYTKIVGNSTHQQWNLRERFRQIDLAYAREKASTKENTRAKIANAYGDSTKIQDITVPVVMPQVEAQVSYQASVFLTGVPIFGVATSPEFVNEGVMLESIIESQQIRAGWVRELLMFFRDASKYNLAPIEISWEQQNTAQITTNLQSNSRVNIKNTVWEGNRIKRLSPYNTFFDTRVAPSRVYCEGEYAGYVELKSRIGLKQFLQSLPVRINVKEALESNYLGGVVNNSTGPFYIPEVNSAAFTDVTSSYTFDWTKWMELAEAKPSMNYTDKYLVRTLYALLLPSDFNLILPERNTPQIFKIITVNDSVVVYVERQTNAHGWLPILIGVPNEDGLDFQTKSAADTAIPFQDVSSALMGSVLAARRRAIGDRILYDPSRVPSALINSPNPVARIPVRPAAYGKPIAESVFPFPFRDDQSGIAMQEIQTLVAMGNDANNINKARQGQFVKGNKTQSEFQTVMANANSRDQVTSMLYESQVFTPLKEIIKINILQYQGAETIFSNSKNKNIEVDPVRMRDAIMSFKISDGIAPTDKLMDADSFTVALQTLGSSPQLNSGYNIAPLFSYLMKQRGADLTPFEKSPEQISYEQALTAWQQAVAEGIKAGATPDKLPPQPKPQDYGYNPQGVGTSAQPKTTTNVNNITNNITDNRGA